MWKRHDHSWIVDTNLKWKVRKERNNVNIHEYILKGLCVFTMSRVTVYFVKKRIFWACGAVDVYELWGRMLIDDEKLPKLDFWNF